MASFEYQENNCGDRTIDKMTKQLGKSVSGCLVRPGKREPLQNTFAIH
jgi:hypothetical protein